MQSLTNGQIAAAVRAEAAARRITQAQLQAVFGVSLPYVSRRFNGIVPFSAVELDKFATFAGVPVERIYERAHEHAAGEVAQGVAS